MNILAYSVPGSKFWRFDIPYKWINAGTDHKAIATSSAITEKHLDWADVIVFHNIVDAEGISYAMAYREMSNYQKKIVVDIDDALFIDKNNPYAKKWEETDATFIITQTIKEADVVTCTTPFLKEELEKYNKNVTVLPNYYDPDWFDVKVQKNDTDSVRIGWTGGVSHYDDFVYIKPVLDELMDKYPKVKMVICGDPRFRSMLKHKDRCELMPPVDIEVYPSRLSGMALDIGIAPLADKPFNLYKSYIKWLEYSLLKVPSVCSPQVYGRVTSNTAGTKEEWIEKLSLLIEDKTYRLDQGIFQYRKALEFNIKDHYKEWISAYE